MHQTGKHSILINKIRNFAKNFNRIALEFTFAKSAKCIAPESMRAIIFFLESTSVELIFVKKLK